MFLTPDELKELTGYRRFADQRRWLSVNGWRFEVARTGQPVVAKSYAESRLGPDAPPNAAAWSPNLAAFSG